MDSLKDLLSQKNVDEPSELTSLKNYFVDTFGFSPSIKITKNNITVTVSNSKLATEIRIRTLEIERRCQLSRNLKVYVSYSSN